MNKLMILIFVSFMLGATVSSLQAQKTPKSTVPVDSTAFSISTLLSPSLQNYGYYNYPDHFSDYRRFQFSTDRKFPVPLVFQITTAVAILQVSDDHFEPVPNYIYSRNIWEYENQLKRRNRYPDNFPIYTVYNNSLLNIFD